MSLSNALPRTFLDVPDFRKPEPEDGAAVYRLIARCPPLDPNSRYCNLLQCSHFSDTSIVAGTGPEIVAFVSGYIVPQREDTLFIWQVAVLESLRGQGIATQMLLDLLRRPACRNIRYIETSITDNNNASKSLFRKLAKKTGAPLKTSLLFSRDKHFDGKHASETLYRIGPFDASLHDPANS